MNCKKILFVIRDIGNGIKDCLDSINRLSVPSGFTVEIVMWKGEDFWGVFHNILRRYDSKYKVYLNSDIEFSSNEALEEMLSIFMSDVNIGLMGVMGGDFCTSLKINESIKLYGGIYRQMEGDLLEERYGDDEGLCTPVQMITGKFIAIQTAFYVECPAKSYCIPEMLSMSYRKHGYSVVVPRQKKLWCVDKEVNQREKEYEDRLAFCRRFAPFALEGTNVKLKKFFAYWGQNIKIGKGVNIAGNENIFLGDNSKIAEEVILQCMGGHSFIKIGEECTVGADSSVKTEGKVYIEDYVCIGKGVHVYGYEWQSNEINIPQNITGSGKDLSIGHGSSIGDGSIVYGASIGIGCKVLPGSVVLNDMPDYCVVGGNPARVLHSYEVESVSPVLSIVIPTYNRSYCLSKALKAVTEQVGNDPLVEIIILDNSSSDDTKAVSLGYQKKFSNVKYIRNEENIGGDANIRLGYEVSHGKYVVCLGDDDYYQKPVLYKLLNLLCSSKTPTIVAMKRSPGQKYKVYEGCGIDDYIKQISHQSTFISILVMNRKLLMDAMKDSRFDYTSIPQLYYSLKMLVEHPNFAILSGDIIEGTSGEGSLSMGGDVSKNKVGFANIFVCQYFDILEVFLKNGLTKETVDNEKVKVFVDLILPHYSIMKKGLIRTYKVDDNAMYIYDKYYRNISGYQQGRERLKQVIM